MQCFFVNKRKILSVYRNLRSVMRRKEERSNFLRDRFRRIGLRVDAFERLKLRAVKIQSSPIRKGWEGYLACKARQHLFKKREKFFLRFPLQMNRGCRACVKRKVRDFDYGTDIELLRVNEVRAYPERLPPVEGCRVISGSAFVIGKRSGMKIYASVTS